MCKYPYSIEQASEFIGSQPAEGKFGACLTGMNDGGTGKCIGSELQPTTLELWAFICFHITVFQDLSKQDVLVELHLPLQ